MPPHSLLRMISTDSLTPKSFAVPLLGESLDSEADLFLGNGITSESREIIRPNSLRMLLRTPTRTVHYYWRKFDNAFMRPVFGGRGFVPFVPGSPTEQSVHNNWPEEPKQ